MQDRFKFRAWDEKNKIYHYEDFVVTATGFIAKISSGGEICQTDMEYDENIVLEQCTGLRDKNGVLIYEGDILNHECFKHNSCAEYGFYGENKKVFFEDGEFTTDSSNGLGLNLFEQLQWSKNLEIIGNIHENPELLEE